MTGSTFPPTRRQAAHYISLQNIRGKKESSRRKESVEARNGANGASSPIIRRHRYCYTEFKKLKCFTIRLLQRQLHRVTECHTHIPTHRHTNTPTPPMHPPTRVHSTTRLAKSCTFYGFSPWGLILPSFVLGSMPEDPTNPPLAKNRILRSPLLVFSWEITDLSWF